MDRGTWTDEAELSNLEHDPIILSPEEQDKKNPELAILGAMASESYFEVAWSQSACVGLPAPLKAGFTADIHYRAGRAGKRLTPEARASMVVCSLCPIRAECGEHGLTEEGGIWGGLTHQIRKDGKEIDDADLAWFERAGAAVRSAPDLETGLAALLDFVESDTSD